MYVYTKFLLVYFAVLCKELIRRKNPHSSNLMAMNIQECVDYADDTQVSLEHSKKPLFEYMIAHIS